LLGHQTFDVVLTDMRMETATAGFDVVRAARQIDPAPVIAILTAFPISPSEWRPSGADALMVKGADIISLPDKLLNLLKARPRSERQPSAIAEQRL
jgi:CheY-like chemotaxis protein